LGAVRDSHLAKADAKLWQTIDKLEDDILTLEPQALLDERIKKAARELVIWGGPALAGALRLADMPNGKYPLVYKNDIISTVLPHVQHVSELQWWLLFDAVDRTDAGDIDGACRTTQAMLNAARGIGDEPLAISQIVRMARVRYALRVLERVLAQGQASAAALTSLQNLVEEEEAFPALLVAMRGERAALDLLMQRLQTGEVSIVELRLNVRGATRRPLPWGLSKARDYATLLTLGPIKTNRAALLEHMNALVELAKRPPEEQGDWEGLKKDRTALPTLAREICPDFVPHLFQSYKQSRAELRCAAALLAAERFRMARGRWPESLTQLVPSFLAKLPADPYDGAALRYRRLADGCLIYALGPDREDNGGVLFRGRGLAPPFGTHVDVGFRLWDIAARHQR
jgi:hypothetical protein